MLTISSIGVSPRLDVAARQTEHGWFSAGRQLPAPGRLVVYQSGGSQQIGYVDETHQWRRLNGQTESGAVTSWIVAKG